MNKSNPKAEAYDRIVAEGDIILRKINKLKSDYAFNMPQNIIDEINTLKRQMVLVEEKMRLIFPNF